MMQPSDDFEGLEPCQEACFRLKRLLMQNAAKHHFKMDLLMNLDEKSIHVANAGETLFCFKMLGEFCCLYFLFYFQEEKSFD